MKNRYLFFFSLCLIVFLTFNSLCFAQLFNWTKQAGGTDSDGGNGISTDANGNSYVTGYFNGTATFGTIQLVSYGYRDIFIAKYDASGNCVWAKNAGGTGFDEGRGISTDANGNSYVTGKFSGTATFGTIQLDGYGFFIAKYDANGNCVWVKNAGGGNITEGRGISIDGNGNSYVTGYFYESATFQTIQLVSNGLEDIFIAKYDVNGNCVWAKNAGGIGKDVGRGISTDANGNSYIIGDFRYGNDDDIFIAKYDANGNSVWAKNAGGTDSDGGRGISADANGNSYVTGNFFGTTTFGTIQLVSQGSSDIFIAKYNASGNCVWAKNAGGTDSDGGNGISIDANGNSYVTGFFRGTATFGTIQLVSNGYYDIFIAKYNASGNCVWAKNAGGIGYNKGNSISIDANGNSYVTGEFQGTATFGTIQLVSFGGYDVFITKIFNLDVFYDRIEFYTNVGFNIDNPNNYLSPGYHIRFRLRIKNDLPINILTAYGTIQCLTPGITVTDSLATYNNVFAGQDGWSIDDYEIYIPNTIELGSQIEFLLTAYPL